MGLPGLGLPPMLRPWQMKIGCVALVGDAVAIAFFLHWLSRTDWLFGHTSGPSRALISAFWAATVGLIATAVWIALAVSNRLSASAEEDFRTTVTGLGRP